MSDKFSCLGMNLPKWIPVNEECVWCNRHTQEPVAIEPREDEFLVYYECTNELCENKKRYNESALYGLIFNGGGFTVNYLQFVRQNQKKQEEQGELNEERSNPDC